MVPCRHYTKWLSIAAAVSFIVTLVGLAKVRVRVRRVKVRVRVRLRERVRRVKVISAGIGLCHGEIR